MQIKDNELFTTREIARELNSTLRLLERGDVEKVVITRSGKVVGVMLSPSAYEKMLDQT